jgi:putative DNA primase/helicase
MSAKKQKATNDFLRTDFGNAELFASVYGKPLSTVEKPVVKFDHKQGRWLRWTPKQRRWMEDKQKQVRQLMKMTARKRLRDAESDEQVKWALHSESRPAIDNALELAKSVEPISDDGERWDANPWLLGVANGVVDLRTGRLRQAKPEDRVTLYLPVAYDPAAKCPRFEQFLQEIFNGDAELIGFIQRSVGYSLTGLVDEHCLFACYGEGANGKSTLLGVVQYILGDYAVNLPFSALEMSGRSSIPNDVAMLAGRRFATAIETGESVRLNEARIKAITGGDLITARHLFKNFFTFAPTHKLWLAFNHKPRICDASEGMWRRIRLIPFLRQFTGDERDKKLVNKLKAEAPGILNWMIEGCRLWQKQGLGEPQVVKNATAAYRDESDHLAQFIEDCCVVDSTATVTSADLWKRYEQWAQDAGEVPLPRPAFGERLKRHGITDTRLGHSGTRGWQGIKLLTPSEEEIPDLDDLAMEPSLVDTSTG